MGARAFLIRADQRIERLEALVKALEARLAALEAEQTADPIKRGPGRPRKEVTNGSPGGH